eukprot:TRINITY_DN6787_c0_g1_i1.p1 TRINITY_DN6787_c0_g1~~TRINITY_DN6787_c0_g1_i1.p1  ORF type:complete len:191 (+),score=58.32 TRINITY_DN6787_c0_g1_i1:347-919(+)
MKLVAIVILSTVLLSAVHEAVSDSCTPDPKNEFGRNKVFETFEEFTCGQGVPGALFNGTVGFSGGLLIMTKNQSGPCKYTTTQQCVGGFQMAIQYSYSSNVVLQFTWPKAAPARGFGGMFNIGQGNTLNLQYFDAHARLLHNEFLGAQFPNTLGWMGWAAAAPTIASVTATCYIGDTDYSIINMDNLAYV